MFKNTLITILLFWASAGLAVAGLTAEDAKKLDGPALTPIGAEKAASADGLVPEYTGGITRGADGFYYEGKLVVPFSKFDGGQKYVKYPDPFADDKPLFTVTSQNMDKYSDKLTDGMKALLKKYPEDVAFPVYPSRRSMSYSDRMLEMQKKAAMESRLEKDGLQLIGPGEAFPFPIPKSGIEMFWNFCVHWAAPIEIMKQQAVMMTTSGRKVITSQSKCIYSAPYWDPNDDAQIVMRVLNEVNGPPQKAGEATMGWHPMDKTEGQPVWQYLPGQRRVKLAPEVSFDGPNFYVSGLATIDECYMWTGSPERYDWKILGKKEMIIPYNNYTAQFWTKTKELMNPHFLEADKMRYEVHRVWLLEANLKRGERHIYKKRVFYIDEDSWFANAIDMYDLKDELWRIKFDLQTFSYDIQAPFNKNDTGFDLVSNIYFIFAHSGDFEGFEHVKSVPDVTWTPAILAGRGYR